MPSGILIHGCPAEHQTLKRGLILVLSSSVPPIIERISGYRSRVIDTADPQVGQKWRHSRFLPSSRVSYVASFPSIVTSSLGKMTPIRNADPDCRWQRSHWQTPMVTSSLTLNAPKSRCLTQGADYQPGANRTPAMRSSSSSIGDQFDRAMCGEDSPFLPGR
jgi:hypothetical protein